MTFVFVYGTLAPGQPRWPALQQYTLAAPPFGDYLCCYRDSIGATLYDTGYGWPAAVIDDHMGNLVPGFSVELDRRHEEEALLTLDRIEGSPHLFERRTVRTDANIQAWVYHWPHPTAGFTKIASWHNGTINATTCVIESVTGIQDGTENAR